MIAPDLAEAIADGLKSKKSKDKDAPDEMEVVAKDLKAAFDSGDAKKIARVLKALKAL